MKMGVSETKMPLTPCRSLLQPSWSLHAIDGAAW
jgi:hypothetical protein